MKYFIINKEGKKELDYSKIDDCDVDGIKYHDSPDYCDAFICSAIWEDGTELTEDEIDILNDDSSYVYEQIERFLY